MTINLEKILSFRVLLVLNILIIIFAELSGRFFEEKGIIHLLAVIFVILGVSRIFVHYEVFDRFLKPFLLGGVAALIIFALSHLVEFLGFMLFHTYSDAVFINVVNFYIISMLMVTIGAEYFLCKVSGKSSLTLWLLWAMTRLQRQFNCS